MDHVSEPTAAPVWRCVAAAASRLVHADPDLGGVLAPGPSRRELAAVALLMTGLTVVMTWPQVVCLGLTILLLAGVACLPPFRLSRIAYGAGLAVAFEVSHGIAARGARWVVVHELIRGREHD